MYEFRDEGKSTIAQKIHTVFKHVGVPCYTRSEGNFHPHGVLFSTIHSMARSASLAATSRESVG